MIKKHVASHIKTSLDAATIDVWRAKPTQEAGKRGAAKGVGGQNAYSYFNS
jgi:hypothetical protein